MDHPLFRIRRRSDDEKEPEAYEEAREREMQDVRDERKGNQPDDDQGDKKQ